MCAPENKSACMCQHQATPVQKMMVIVEELNCKSRQAYFCIYDVLVSDGNVMMEKLHCKSREAHFCRFRGMLSMTMTMTTTMMTAWVAQNVILVLLFFFFGPGFI